MGGVLSAIGVSVQIFLGDGVKEEGFGLVKRHVGFSKLTGRLNMLRCPGFPKEFLWAFGRAHR
jgi:hypothetical protein